MVFNNHLVIKAYRTPVAIRANTAKGLPAFCYAFIYIFNQIVKFIGADDKIFSYSAFHFLAIKLLFSWNVQNSQVFLAEIILLVGGVVFENLVKKFKWVFKNSAYLPAQFGLPMVKIPPACYGVIVEVTGADSLAGYLANQHPLIFSNHFNLQVLRFIIAIGVRYFQG